MKDQIVAQFRAVYGRAPEFVTRAPGRIEFIGNHTDYNGGTVLGASIDRSVWVALARRDDEQKRFYSAISGEIVALPAGSAARQSDKASWINYPLGVWVALPQFGLKQPTGFDYLALSNLPLGSGLSSSAAIELASALAFLTATKQQPDRETVVKIGKHAENNFVGVPCGILDQGVSGFGRKDSLVFIDCRGPRFATVPLPSAAHFWVFNTHTKHALVDGLYAARHRECMDAAKALGVGLLADVKPPAVEAARGKLAVESFKRAKHVVEEIDRVDQCVRALEAGDLAKVGKLLTASHRSSQMLFENSTTELDFLVDTLTTLPEVFGARLSGGGFGGAVMALTDANFSERHAAKVIEAYAARFGAKPEVLHCQTADGAEVLGGA
jgi:galactokinase